MQVTGTSAADSFRSVARRKMDAPGFAGMPPAAPGNASPLLRASAPDRVTFSGTQARPPQYTEQELVAMEDDLSAIHTTNRLDALLKLKDLDAIPNHRLARSISRYLYFNDSLYETRKPARWLATEILEKNRSPWSADALTVNPSEVSDRNLARYTIGVLSRLYPGMPERLQQRVRTGMMNSFLSARRYAGSRDPDIINFFKRHTPKEDINLLWYLMSESLLKRSSVTSTTDNTSVMYPLMQIFTHVMGREYGADYFNLLLDDYRQLRTEGRSDSGFSIGDNMFLMIGVKELPTTVLMRSHQELKKLGQEEIKKTANVVADALVFLCRNTLVGQVNTLDRDQFGKAISRLIPLMDEDTRQEFSQTLLKQVEASPNSVELLANLVETLHPGKTDYETAMKGFIDPKLGRFQYHQTSLIDALMGEDSDRTPQGVLNRLKAMSNPNQWQYRKLVPTAEEVRAPFVSQLDPEPVQGRQSTLELFDLDSNARGAIGRLPGRLPVRTKELPKDGASPVPQTNALPNLKYEVSDQLAEHQQELADAVRSDKILDIQSGTEVLVDHWLATRSGAALDFLTGQFDNPDVLATFLSYLSKLHDKLKTSPALISESRATGENTNHPLAIPPEELMSALLKMPAAGGLKFNDTTAKHFRDVLLAAVEKAPQFRDAALKLTLDAYRAMDWPEVREDRARQDLAMITFNLLKSGVPDWVKQEYAETLPDVLKQATYVLTVDTPDTAYTNRKNIDWSVALAGEQDSYQLTYADQASPEYKNDLDQLLTLGIVTGDDSMLESLMNRLYSQYENIRGNSYADKLYFVHFLRNPKLTQVALQSKDEQLFQRFTEMAGWYKVFEAVPQMVEYGAEAPLGRKVRIQSAIATMMDFYAMPELRELKSNGRTRAIREFARDTLREMSQPKAVNSFHSPMVDTLPKQLRQRLEALKAGQGLVRPSDQSASVLPQSFNDMVSRRKVVLDGVDALPQAPVASSDDGTTGVPTISTKQGGLQATRRKVRILGADTLEEGGGSFLSQMRTAFFMLRSTSDKNLKTQASNELLELAQQFKNLAQSKNGNIKFITPEKTQLAADLGQRLIETTDSAEQSVLCRVLGELQEASVAPYLLRHISQELSRAGQAGNPALGLPLKALGALGAVQYQAEIRALLDQAPQAQHQSILQVMESVGDTEGLAEALLNRDYPEETRAWLAKTVSQKVVEGYPDLEADVTSRVLNGLRQAAPNSPAERDYIGAFYWLVQGDEADMAELLVQRASVPNAERPLKKAVLEVLQQFTEIPPAVSRWVNDIKRGEDVELRREAQAVLDNLDN